MGCRFHRRRRRSAMGRLRRLHCTPASGRNRRVSPVASRSREGLLTEPTPAVRPWSRERVFMPLLRHSLRRVGRGILPFGSARSVWSNTPSRPLGSDRNDVAANCRDVEGNHRLGQAPQGERAELLGFDASFERRVDALAEQDFQVDAAGGGGALGGGWGSRW